MTITVIRHPLTDEERSQNRSALIKHLKDRKRLAQEEMQEEYRTNPKIKQIFEELRQQNEIANAL